jgi:hypothetical protein
MKKSLMILATIVTVSITLFSSCGSIKPSSFVQATDGGTWSSIFIREDLTYDKAFNEVLDVCAKRFEMGWRSLKKFIPAFRACECWNCRS